MKLEPLFNNFPDPHEVENHDGNKNHALQSILQKILSASKVKTGLLPSAVPGIQFRRFYV